MAWNEPDKDKNPWGDENRAPELDDLVRKMNQRFGSLFGGKGGGNGGNGMLLVVLLLVAVVGWIFAGFYTVDASARGVVQRFGAFSHLSEPGLRWRPAFIDTVAIVQVEKVQEFNHSSSMLTGDANIIDIDVNVQYLQADARKFVFNVRDPDKSLFEVTEAAIRGVAGKYDMEAIQTTLRNEVAQEARREIQRILNTYDAGITVTKVNLNDTEFPAPVRDAVQDVIKASRDQERYILEAESYRNDILPKARGQAAGEIQDAEGYRDRLIANSTGEAERFRRLLVQYTAAPAVTRERLYLETIEQVYGDNAKVLMDNEGGGNLMYLPIDKLIENKRGAANATAPAASTSTSGQQRVDSTTTTRARDTSRLRARERN